MRQPRRPADAAPASEPAPGEPTPADAAAGDAAFAPFADDAAVRMVGGLAFENGRARITVHGALDLSRDRVGLARARLLRETLDAVVSALEAADSAGDLPEAADEAPDREPGRVANPFA